MLFQSGGPACIKLINTLFSEICIFSPFLGPLGKLYLVRVSFSQAGHMPLAELISRKMSII